MTAQEFFSGKQKEAIVHAIQQAEKMTSGEIRVHIENTCRIDPVKRAEKVFGMMKMQRTEKRNGVLFYLAVHSRVFAIYADKGIHEKCGMNSWNNISERMQQHFSRGNFTEGLVDGIRMAGEKLKHFFPEQPGDKNELSDEISFR